MKRMIISLLIFLLVSQAVECQEKIIQVYLKFERDGEVKLNDVRVKLGYPNKPDVYSNYSIELESNGKTILEKKFFLSFTLMSDPPIELNETGKTINLEYFDDVDYLIVKKNGEEIFRYQLAGKLCNPDKNCEGFETHFSCPEDCKSGSLDGVCNPVRDGMCDQDCFKSADVDCTKKPFPKYPIIILSIIVLVVLVLVIVFLRNRKPKQNF